MSSSLIYREQSATFDQILSHLEACKNTFVPPLDQKVNLVEYSRKISENAVTFEVWQDSILVSLIAAYYNDRNKKTAFITNVSTLPAYRGKGLASQLLSNCIRFGKENSFSEIFLEVNNNNQSAIRLYKSHGFETKELVNDQLILNHLII